MKKVEKIMQSLIWLALLATGLFISCQNEDFDQNTGSNSQTLSETSNLTRLLSRVSMENTVDDNVLDSTSCFKVKLPVNVLLFGQETFTVNSEEDFATVHAILVGAGDNASVDFNFPITVIFPDYTEQIVTSQAQFDQLSNCEEILPGEGPISCVSIQYPIQIFGYNSANQATSNFTVNNNSDLQIYITLMQSTDYFSISYPISATNASGQTIIINNNSEFEALILQSIPFCTTQIDCTNPHILTDDLIIYMPFANQIKDLVSMDYGITTATDTVFVTDRSGNANSAISFSGANDHLKLLENGIRNIEQVEPMSISVWVKMQNTIAQDFEGIFERTAEVPELGQPGYGLAIFDLNAPMFYGQAQVFGDPFNLWDLEWTLSTTLPIDVTNWHHIVVTVEFTTANELHQVVKLYRDGVLRNTGEADYSSFTNTQVFDFFVGRGFHGYMDDLRVYKKTLSAQEVNMLYQLEGDTNTCF